ncbi:sensor histidine kinase [Segnochrobactraceae bacterium EtOH-i3]
MYATGRTLLYIDDDPGIGRLVQKGLARTGMQVETRADGPSGIARLRDGGIDIVALDHHMPGVTGLEVLAEIATLADAPPVIYVTGESEGRVAVAALKAGAADYVVKEASGEFLSLLRKAIADALEARALRQAREEAEAEVRAARDAFKALAEERAMLLREVNHRVGNSLQLITAFLRLQASSSDSPDVRAALTDAIGRVNAVAQVHHRLYTSDAVHTVALDQYLKQLAGDLARTVTGSGEGRIHVTAEPIAATTDQVVSIGIVVTELAINALKYAYPDGDGPVRILCTATDSGGIRIIVEDDGCGLGRTIQGTGLGQRIVDVLVTKLAGTITTDPDHAGARFVLTLPPAPEETP